MARLSYLEAGRQALAEEMRRDRNVWALGEDLGRGGVFGQYRGLVEEFGADRISDAPISESAILGAAVGAAMITARRHRTKVRDISKISKALEGFQCDIAGTVLARF